MNFPLKPVFGKAPDMNFLGMALSAVVLGYMVGTYVDYNPMRATIDRTVLELYTQMERD